jgi:alpha-1,2-mannosyltransferase
MRATFVAVGLLAAVAVIWCGQTIRKAERSTGNDLVGYLAASEALYAQQDPYHLPDRFPYIYPLFLATVIRPLAALPVRAASVAWFVLQWACLIYVLRAARLRFGRREVTGAVAILILVAIFGDVLQLEFLNGQVNLIVVGLIVASVALAEVRPSIAPALLGAAIAIKLTPALMLVYWVVQRRFAFVAQAFAWAVAFILLPWIVVRGRLWPMYGDYLHNFILARTRSADPHGREIFFSVYGFIGWLTGSAPGRAIVVASAVVVLGGLIAWRAHVRRSHVARRTSHVEAWVYLAATPLLSPMSEVHHLTAALPLASISGVALLPFAALLWIGRFDRRGPWYFLAVLTLVIAVCVAMYRRPREEV